MEAVAGFVKSELRDWKTSEVCWMGAAILTVVVITIHQGGDSLIGIISAVTGILYTLLSGKGKASCYLFGVVNTILYGYIAFSSRIYGDMLLNWCYYLPMQFAGFMIWLRHRQELTGTVRKRKLTHKHRILTLLATLAAWISGAVILKYTGDASPWLDSATTVISITAMVLSVMRCFEQWICWTLVNGISIWMWLDLYLRNNDSLATLLMWSVFLICGIVFGLQWLKAAEEEENHEN